MPYSWCWSRGRNWTRISSAKINTAIRSQFSPRHVPDEVLAVPAIPRTLSDKKMEVPVKKLFMRVPIDKAANIGATRSPEAVQYFADLSRSHSPLLNSIS